MQDKEPTYFKEFRIHVDKKFDAIDIKFDAIDKKFDAIDKKFDAIDRKFETIEEKIDTHFETIGEMKVQITNIELNLDNKANRFYADGIDNRVEKLEKAVFA